MRTVSVLHVRSSVYPGGPETTLIGWLRYADRAGFAHHLMFFDEKQGLHQRSVAVFADHGLPVELLPWAPSRRVFAAIRTVVARARERSPCIIHAHDVRSDFVALVAGRWAGVPVVVSNHAWHAQGLKRRIQEGLRARWLPYADIVLNVSDDTHRETLRRGVPVDRSVALYSGLDLAPYRELPTRDVLRQRLGIAPTAPVISNVARAWPEKALHTLIEAAARLRERHPGLQILQVGDGPLLEDLQRQVAERQLGDTVRLMGFRTDYPDIMKASDIFALPSLAEGMPMVIYSAMALGLPIVTSDVNGMRDALRHEDSALIMRPGHVDDLTACLDRLLTDHALAQRLGENARLLMEQQFSAQRTVQRLEQIYLDVLERHRPGAWQEQTT